MDDKGFESLNMIPFIDIMLVLLTIVLTTSSFIATGRIAVNLPAASRQQVEQSHQPWVIQIDAEGALSQEDESLSLEALAARVSDLEKDTAFLLRADKAVGLQYFIDVVDMLKQKGFEQVAVETVATQ